MCLKEQASLPHITRWLSRHFQLRFRIISPLRFTRAKKLSITADGKTDSVYVPNGNVCDVLNQLGYKLSDDDILSVDKDSNIEDADSITIKRVTYRNETETQSVDFETVKKNSKDVDLGKTKVQTEGKQGEALVTKKCKYVDGKKVSSETVDTKITKEPVDKVVLMGTKGSNVSNPAGTFTDMNGNTVAYSSVVTGSGTAYTAPAGSLTATGVTAYHGGVAVNPNIIPYGSKLYMYQQTAVLFTATQQPLTQAVRSCRELQLLTVSTTHMMNV